MVKKIIITSCLMTATLLQAEITQKGFFVGIDLGISDATTKYEKNGVSITTTDYEASTDKTLLSLKAGYQYYFTRIYARITDSKQYEDTAKQRYTLENQVLEVCVDYIPVFYTAKNNRWDLRGVFGLGVGLNRGNLSEFDVRLDATPSMLNTDSQQAMEYGYEIGLLVEAYDNFSAEIGMRYRTGNVAQFQDSDQNEVTFSQETTEYYLGINYLF